VTRSHCMQHGSPFQCCCISFLCFCSSEKKDATDETKDGKESEVGARRCCSSGVAAAAGDDAKSDFNTTLVSGILCGANSCLRGSLVTNEGSWSQKTTDTLNKNGPLSLLVPLGFGVWRVRPRKMVGVKPTA